MARTAGEKAIRQSPHALGWSLALPAAAFFMVTLDALVVVTALPQIHRSIGGTVSSLDWAVNAYLLAFAAGIITASSMGERWGRRRLYVIGLAVFGTASAACAIAPSTGALVAARAVQGLGAAIVAPLSLTILTAAFPPEKRGRVIGLWGGLAGLGIAIGPVIGGAVTQGLDWHWIFWVNVPVALVAAVLSAIMLAESRGERRPLDLAGAALASGGAALAIWGLVNAGSHGFGSAESAAPLAGGIALLAAFVLYERRAPSPMVPMGMFRERGFLAGNIAGLMCNASVFGAAFLMSQYFQLALGFGPLGTGWRFLPWTATPLLVAPLAGGLCDRKGPRALLAGGLALQAAGLAWVASAGTQRAHYSSLVVPLVLAGIGVSMAIPSATVAVLASVRRSQAGAASGVLNTMQRFGGALGIAVVSEVFSAHGNLASRSGFDSGFRPALVAAASISLVGAAAGALVRRPAALPGRVEAEAPGAELAAAGVGA